MSRLERKAQIKIKKSKKNTRRRILFLGIMVLNLLFSIFLVEKSANEYLGSEDIYLENKKEDLKDFISSSFIMAKSYISKINDYINTYK